VVEEEEALSPSVVFIHGTGADKSSWRDLVSLLHDRVRATVYDRRGTSAWPVADGDRPPLVHDHAEDAAGVIGALGAGPVHVCAISFGAVIALELMKRRPELVQRAILFEPALSGDDRISSVPEDLRDGVEQAIARGEPERAAEFFHRRVLGDAAWQARPAVVRADLTTRGRQIGHDLAASAAYRVRYDELRHVTTPTLLLQGGRSRPVFEPALRALHAVLLHARRQRIESAGHVPAGEAWREFADALTGFMTNGQ
jgi:pimeloyl-ACP methyl ester carboxylesterase